MFNKSVLASLVTLFSVTFAFGGTYTWTGAAGDGLYFTAGNWNYEGETATSSPGSAPGDDIVISGSGVEVAYVPGGDWAPTGNITISNGAKLVQTTGNNYANIRGTMTLDGGTYDAGTCSGLTLSGRLVVKEGGELISNVALGRGADSVLELRGGSLPTVEGNYALANYPNDIYAGGTFSLTNELQPPSGDRIWEGTAWVCKMFAPRGAGEHTFKSGSLTVTTTSYSGYYQNNSHINVPADSTATFTWSCKASEVYSKTFGSSTTDPKFRYAGGIITKDEFESLFRVTDNDGKAPCTFSLIPPSDTLPKFGDVSVVLGDASDRVVVNASFVYPGDPAATVYLAWDADDRGRTLADWGENIKELGTASAESSLFASATGLPTKQKLFFRLFADTGAEVAVSELKSVYMHYYDVEGVVNEWIGTVGNWTDASNWSLGHQPTDGEICWIENESAVVSKASYKLNDSDHLIAGTLAVTGEISADVDYTLDGFNLSCTTFVPGNHKLTIKNGSFTAYRSGSPEQAVAGVYGGGAKIDFLSGGTAAMCFYSSGTIYADTFGGDRFTFNGLKIDETEFSKRFEYALVEGKEEVIRNEVPYNAYRLSLKASEGEPKVESFGASFANDQVTFTLQQTADSINDTIVTVYYGTTDCGATTEGWAFSAVMGKDETEGYNTATVDVTPGSRYYYAISAASESAEMTIWRTGDVVAANLPTDRKVWFGKTADAADTANWQGGALPGPQDVIEISDVFSKTKRIDWNVAEIPAVAGWIQSSGIVYFNTTREQALTIKGDVALSGSANWTHLGPSDTPTYCLNVAVEGDMAVGAGCYVQGGVQIINNEDYRARGYHKGPGYQEVTKETFDEEGQTNIVSLVYLGGSYAGDAGHQPFAGSFVSYGSILNPMEWGSAGKGDSTDSYSGAGLVKLTVSGALTVDGSIESHGFGYGSQPAGASGGTVNITAASLSGNGSINADGGLSNRGPGSGGRVAVTLTGATATFDAFDAPTKIHANPGVGENYTGDFLALDVVVGAAGTVVLKTASDAENGGRVVISDSLPADARRVATDTTSLVSGTHLPSRQNLTENLKATRWELLNYGKIRLTADAKISALTLASDAGENRILTDGHKLVVNRLVINGVRRRGTLTAQTHPNLVEGTGCIEASGSGITVVIR